MESAAKSQNAKWWQLLQPAPVPESIQADLIKLQHQRIGQLIPVLYFTIAIIAIVAGSASSDEFDVLSQVIMPCGFVGMGIYRCLVWHLRKSKPVDLEKAEKHLQSTTWLAIGMGLIGGIWTIDAYYETEEARRVLAPVFIFMLMFAAAICLNSLPKAAIGAMVTALLPPSVAMITSSDAGIQAMGISLMIVSLLIAGLVLTSFAQIVSGLKLQRELEYLASTDVLTGLSNRRAFSNILEEQIQNAESGSDQGSFAIMMIDLDGFKAVNDTHGHVAGDQLLCEVANRLQTICGHARSIARLGGDEFALILAISDQKLLTNQSSAIKTMLSMPYEISGKQVSISASVGTATYPNDGQEISELLKSADHVLYEDKIGKAKAKKMAAR